MEKLLLKLLGQKIMDKIKTWLKENGFGGILALAVVGVAAFMGMWYIVVGALCWFLGKNWEIIVNIYKDKYKDKVEDLVDEVKDKIGK